MLTRSMLASRDADDDDDDDDDEGNEDVSWLHTRCVALLCFVCSLDTLVLLCSALFFVLQRWDEGTACLLSSLGSISLVLLPSALCFSFARFPPGSLSLSLLLSQLSHSGFRSPCFFLTLAFFFRLLVSVQ